MGHEESTPMKDLSRLVILPLALVATLAQAEAPVTEPSDLKPEHPGTIAPNELAMEPFAATGQGLAGPQAPSSCVGNNIWVGQASSETPNLVTPQCSAGGMFDATLACNEGAADLDLYLDLQSCSWFGCGFTSLDASTSAACDEDVTTSGSNGIYRWRINHYSGPAESFYLCTNQC